MDKENLTDKVIVITKATEKVGQYLAQMFADLGAKLLLVDSLAEKLNHLKESLGSEDCQYLALNPDTPQFTERCVQEALGHYDSLDVLISSPCTQEDFGVSGPKTPDTYQKINAVNLQPVWEGLKYGVPAIAKSGGGSFIILLPKLANEEDDQLNRMGYQALLNLIHTAAVQAAKIDVRLHGLSLDFEKDVNEAQTLAEIARLVIFLAGDESKFVTGSLHTPNQIKGQAGPEGQ